MQPIFDTLPVEVVSYILEGVPEALLLFSCSRVCHLWREISQTIQKKTICFARHPKDIEDFPRQWESLEQYKKWLRCRECIENLSLDTLQHIEFNFLDDERLILVAAAETGRTDVLEWREKVEETPRRFCTILSETAALHGQIDVLEYLYKKPYFLSWSVFVCGLAAQGGSLETLVWLRGKGASWGSTLYFSVMNEHENIVDWALENGCPEDQCLTHSMWIWGNTTPKFQRLLEKVKTRKKRKRNEQEDQAQVF